MALRYKYFVPAALLLPPRFASYNRSRTSSLRSQLSIER